MTTGQPEEEPLMGGNMNDSIVRVGDTVRRTATPHSATIQRLLKHVRDQGVTWVPQAHGFDEQRRDVLEYLPGEVVHDQPAWLWDDAILTRVARAARQWHDATETFERSADDVWFWPPGRKPYEVIAHNDFAPYNHVFRDGQWVGAIDFDLCYPAPRLWDLAWTAYRYVPLTPPVDADVDDGPESDRSPWRGSEPEERLAAFLDAYGPLAKPGEAGPPQPYLPAELLSWLPERLYAIADWASQQDSADHQRWARMYRAHAQWVQAGGLAAESG